MHPRDTNDTSSPKRWATRVILVLIAVQTAMWLPAGVNPAYAQRRERPDRDDDREREERNRRDESERQDREREREQRDNERRQREESERRQREESDRRQREESERRQREENDRRQREENDRRQREENDRRQREQQERDRQDRERREREERERQPRPQPQPQPQPNPRPNPQPQPNPDRERQERERREQQERDRQDRERREREERDRQPRPQPQPQPQPNPRPNPQPQPNPDRERQERERREREERDRTERERQQRDNERRQREEQERRRQEQDRARQDQERRQREQDRNRGRETEDVRRQRREAERDRRERENREDRAGRNRDQIQQRQRERRDAERRERDRRMQDRERARREEAQNDRFERERRMRERMNRRQDHRRDYDRYVRRIPRNHYPDIRDRNRWGRRQQVWWEHCYRPLPPLRTIYVYTDDYVYWPEDGDYWDRIEVMQLAETLEAVAYRLYIDAEKELKAPTQWNNETLALLYDVVIAAQAYNDAVHTQTDIFGNTLYELFNLEEAIHLAAARVLCGPVSPVIRDNFAQLKYYVAELLWQYRLDPTYATQPKLMSAQALMNTNFETSDFGLGFRDVVLGNDLEILSCESATYKWSKPHDEAYWDIGLQNAQMQAEQLVITSMSTGGRKGKNGIAGITDLWVYYTDGTSVDLVAQQKRLRDVHVHTNGQLKLVNDADSIKIPLNPAKSIETIYMKADSWIAVDVPVQLNMALTRQSKPVVTRLP